MLLAACQATTAPPSPAAETPGTSPQDTVPPSVRPTAGPSSIPTPSVIPSPAPGGVYAATVSGILSPAVQDIPARVWVPNERGSRVVVIDPTTFEIVDRLDVGAYPEHVSPSWDGQLLYVNDMHTDFMSVIDPRTGKVTGRVAAPSPYNLYFTPAGDRAIVVEDMLQGAPKNENGLRWFTYPDFKELGFTPIRWAGADHLDFSADGNLLYLSCEYSARVEVVDVASMTVKETIVVGGLPTDVRLAPDGVHLFVANQLLDGVTVIDTNTNKVVDFVKLREGSHGLALSRDTTRLYVTNRVDGSISVIDTATLDVRGTWRVGGSPDMIAVSPDGGQLWISNRWDRTVIVVDTATGKVIKTIETGAYPHGLAYWPLPGRFSLGHNGNMR
jgi:YVTN family beta-propeller protein